jgi:hypothetical protein
MRTGPDRNGCFKVAENGLDRAVLQKLCQTADELIWIARAVIECEEFKHLAAFRPLGVVRGQNAHSGPDDIRQTQL